MKALGRQARRRLLKDGPDPIDVFVGRRVRECRKRQRLSLSAVAKCLGVTFQAVQRYESGSNRIAASTLYRLAQVLDVAPGFFFEGYDGPGSSQGVPTP